MLLNNTVKSSAESAGGPSIMGPKQKFERAMQHANHVDEIYKSWRKAMVDNPQVEFPIIQSPNKLSLTVKKLPADPLLALIVGDFIHNLRVSLDHLAGQLALLEGCDIKKHSTLAFPIYIDESDYKNNEAKKINKFIKNNTVLKEIENVQPYHENHPEADPLWLLSELDNIDKHRLLLVVKSVIKKKGESPLANGPANNDYPPADANQYTMGFQMEIQPNNPEFTEKSASHYTTFWFDTSIILSESGLACDGWPILELIRILSTRVQGIITKFDHIFLLHHKL